MKIKKKWILSLIALILFMLIGWTLWANTALEVNEYEIVNDRIPEVFAGFRIAQVSDLHNKDFGEGYGQLLTLLSQINPDIIVVTGDLIDSRQTDLDIALEFAWQAGKIARVYYVSGNHEARVPEYEDLKIGLVKAGVVMLENQKVQITREGESITIMGIDDPSFQEDYLFGDSESVARQAIENLQNESDEYTILLSHRPELFDLYLETEMDLVFSGHAHGGQFTEENTTMIVSRGVGNSIIPIRFNNRPEIVLVTLRNMK